MGANIVTERVEGCPWVFDMKNGKAWPQKNKKMPGSKSLTVKLQYDGSFWQLERADGTGKRQTNSKENGMTQATHNGRRTARDRASKARTQLTPSKWRQRYPRFWRTLEVTAFVGGLLYIGELLMKMLGAVFGGKSWVIDNLIVGLFSMGGALVVMFVIVIGLVIYIIRDRRQRPRR